MDYEMMLAFARHYTPEIAAILYVTGVVLLLGSLRAQTRLAGTQTRAIAELQSEVSDGAQARHELNKEIAVLSERCDRLLERQEQAEKRLPGSRRFDRAVRMIKRGAGDEATLHDMGLSDGEARLLMRLHGTNDEPQATAPVVAAQAKALVAVMEA